MSVLWQHNVGVSLFAILLITNCRLSMGSQSECSDCPTTKIESLPRLGAVTSGARSAYPLAQFADFNLFNLFNVFRGSESKLVDEQGNLKPLDEHEDALQADFSAPNTQTSTSPSRKLSKILEEKLGLHKITTVNDQTNQSAGSQQTPSRPEATKAQHLSPVILVPGYGGSRLEARWDKSSVVRYFCDSHADWTDIWINVKLLLPYMIDCLIDNLRLEFEPRTNETHNTNGVEIRVKNESSISSVEYLHSLPLSGFAYFAPIIKQLTGRLDYTRELNILGAPYDFRKAPNELASYFEGLKTKSERMFAQNNQQPVSFICHSMGCNNMLYFLQRQTDDWKTKHVKRLISIAAPWAGSLSALRAAALGDDLGMPYLFSESKLILVQRSLPSTIFLFPHKRAFSGVPLIISNVGASPHSTSSNGTTNSTMQLDRAHSAATISSAAERKEYTADNFKPFFDAISHPDGYQMWLNTKDLLGSLEPPGVELWCLVGRGQKTLGRMEYLGEFPYSASSELYDDGDGTVSLDSASFCRTWSAQQEQPIYYHEFDAAHMEILRDHRMLEFVESIFSRDVRANANSRS